MTHCTDDVATFAARTLMSPATVPPRAYGRQDIQTSVHLSLTPLKTRDAAGDHPVFCDSQSKGPGSLRAPRSQSYQPDVCKLEAGGAN